MTAGLLLGLLLAQNGAAQAPATAPDDLRRIRQALDEPAPVALVSAPARREGSLFRVSIEAFDAGQPWTDRSGVPGYVRPSFTSYHYEFLQQVTPKEFRSGTLYPGALGLPLVPLVQFFAETIGEARRKSDENDAREAVRRELQRFLACRAAATPGCTRQ